MGFEDQDDDDDDEKVILKNLKNENQPKPTSKIL